MHGTCWHRLLVQVVYKLLVYVVYSLLVQVDFRLFGIDCLVQVDWYMFTTVYLIVIV